MLREFLKHGKKRITHSQTRSRFQRRVPVLSLELADGLVGYEPTCDSLAKGFRWIFAVEFLVRKIQKILQKKTIRQKIRHAKTNNSMEHNPPKTHELDQKSTNKSSCQTSKRRRLAPTIWAWPRLPCWNALAIPQLLLVVGARVAAHPLRRYF